MAENKLSNRIISMLKENTGEHLLDSGGAYGRHWQENQTRDFAKEPELKIEGDSRNDISLSKSTYWHLMHCLEITEMSEALDLRLKRFGRKKDYGWLAIMEEFADELKAEGFIESHHTFNTYNGENLLDQTLQGVWLTGRTQDYIILQVHGGCDVRGGYTDPRIFAADENFHLVADAQIDYTEKESGYEESMTTDDAGYHWYVGGSSNGKVNEVKTTGKPNELLLDGKVVIVRNNTVILR